MTHALLRGALHELLHVLNQRDARLAFVSFVDHQTFLGVQRSPGEDGMVIVQNVGPYTILGKLGEGGMGEVFRARDPRLAREVAVKVVRPELAADVQALRRFEQEARSVGALNHPNILAVYDVGREDGSPYLVSELLAGEPLSAQLHGPLALQKALAYGLQIARGLAASHHRASSTGTSSPPISSSRAAGT